MSHRKGEVEKSSQKRSADLRMRLEEKKTNKAKRSCEPSPRRLAMYKNGKQRTRREAGQEGAALLRGPKRGATGNELTQSSISDRIHKCICSENVKVLTASSRLKAARSRHLLAKPPRLHIMLCITSLSHLLHFGAASKVSSFIAHKIVDGWWSSGHLLRSGLSSAPPYCERCNFHMLPLESLIGAHKNVRPKAPSCSGGSPPSIAGLVVRAALQTRFVRITSAQLLPQPFMLLLLCFFSQSRLSGAELKACSSHMAGAWQLSIMSVTCAR